MAGAFRKIDKGRLACAVIKGKIKYAKKRYVCNTPVELKRCFPVASTVSCFITANAINVLSKHVL